MSRPALKTSRPALRTLAATLLGAVAGGAFAAAAAEADIPAALRTELYEGCGDLGRLHGDENCDQIAVQIWSKVTADKKWAAEAKDPKVRPAALKFCEERCQRARGN